MGEDYGDGLRAQIDDIDEQIRDLIQKRFDTVLALHIWKSENNFPIFDPDREEEIIGRYIEDFGDEDGRMIAKSIIGSHDSE